jgi:hypothetical protein
MSSNPGTVVAAGNVVVPGGEQGPPGATGPTGTRWWNGVGPPTPPPSGYNPGDYYLDTSSGDVWVL